MAAEGQGLEELNAVGWSLVGIKMGEAVGGRSGLVKPDNPDTVHCTGDGIKMGEVVGRTTAMRCIALATASR